MYASSLNDKKHLHTSITTPTYYFFTCTGVVEAAQFLDADKGSDIHAKVCMDS